MNLYNCMAILALFSIIHAILAEFLCRSSKHCMCFKLQDAYELHCSDNIQIKFKPKKYLELVCLHEIQWNTQSIPLLEAGDLTSLTFRMCPYSANFTENLNRIGVSSTKILNFEFFTHSVNFTLISGHLEGMRNLELLRVHYSNVQVIDKDVFKMLNKLTGIDLTFNNLQLTSDTFRYASTLKLLDISGNNLLHIPFGLFHNLVELIALYISYNNLTTINSNVFEKLQNLELLELSGNQLQQIEEDAFYELGSLKKLSLLSNCLQSIPQNLFSKNTNLEFVSLNKNPFLSSLPNNLFVNLTKLKNISANECQLGNLPHSIFHGLRHIENIELSHNRIDALSVDLFKDSRELQHLDVSYNKIEVLPVDIFSALDQLKTLNLQHNLLTYISKDIFRNLQEAVSINLKNNKLNFIDMEAFQFVINLKEIILANNNLDFLESQFFSVSPLHSNLKLEKIDLSSNRIRTISDDWIISHIHLHKLDLSHNRINYLNYASLVTTSNRAKINLMHNNISTIDFSYAEAMARSERDLNIEWVDSENTMVFLNDNPINCDCRIYDFIRYFEGSISLSVANSVIVKANNLMCATPKHLVGFSVRKLKTSMLTCALEQIDDHLVCPENCDCAVRQWDKLLTINCANKNFTDVPRLNLPRKSFYNQTAVHLQGNLLTSAPKENMGYENVTKLFLSSNKIDAVTWIPPKIEVLELNNNSISYFSDKVMSALDLAPLVNISLGNNPWKCDCSSLNLTTFILSHLTTTWIDASNIKCRNRHQLLLQLMEDDVCPDNEIL